MRRSRTLREYRNKLIRRQAKTVADRKKDSQKKIIAKRNPELVQYNRDQDQVDLRHRQIHKRRRPQSGESNYRSVRPKNSPAIEPSTLGDFLSFDSYAYKSRKVRVCHYIDSLGMGGAQTMMMELVNALNRYYGAHIENFVTKKGGFNTKFTDSYGITPVDTGGNLTDFLKKNKIDICLHHRTANARCMKDYLPKNVKYIILNHTWHRLGNMQRFTYCDYYVSVCKFLHKHKRWPSFVHRTRQLVILNGAENEYLDDIKPRELAGEFKIGRCHRLVPSKFRNDSLRWIATKASASIKGLVHYLIGHSKDGKAICDQFENLVYFGSITNRQKKMSILKSLDLYFYETFQQEGASMAILESLAAGVPVLCKPLGGNIELIKHGVNGYIVGDRSEFLLRMKELSESKGMLDRLKETTKRDFNKRLHIRHTVCKYMQVFENLIKL